MERGYITGAKSLVTPVKCAVVSVARIPFYKLPVRSHAKFHCARYPSPALLPELVSIGHSTVLGSCVFFHEADEPIRHAESVWEDESLFLPGAPKCMRACLTR